MNESTISLEDGVITDFDLDVSNNQNQEASR